MGLVACRFDSQPGQIKDCNNGPQCLSAWHSVSRVEIGGLDAVRLLPTTSSEDRGSNMENKFYILWDAAITGT